MTARDDLDRQLDAFLADGPTELPTPSYYAVRDRTERTRQRAVIGLWRLPDTMNRYIPIGLGAAAVVVVLLAGAQFLGVTSGVGGAPAPTPTATPTPQPSVAGRQVLFTRANQPIPGGLGSMLTIPLTGWQGDPGGGVLVKGDGSLGAGMIGLWHEPLYVYRDPCHWSTTTPTTPARTVDEIVAALASQATRDASAPVDVTLDGYKGKMITLHVPENLKVSGEGSFTDCDQDRFGSWGADSEPGEPVRHNQLPGQIDDVWVVDVDGTPAVIDGAHYTSTPAETVAEMRAIIESIDIQP